MDDIEDDIFIRYRAHLYTPIKLLDIVEHSVRNYHSRSYVKTRYLKSNYVCFYLGYICNADLFYIDCLADGDIPYCLKQFFPGNAAIPPYTTSFTYSKTNPYGKKSIKEIPIDWFEQEKFYNEYRLHKLLKIA